MTWETAKNAAILAAALYGALSLALYLMQDRLIYYPEVPSREYEATPAQFNMNFETVTLTASDGVLLTAWYVPAKSPRDVVLFAHGNAGNISHRLDAIRLFHDMGLSVFIFDYRGYGQSAGKPDEEGTYRDAESAWQYLTVIRNIAPEHIVIFGESLGTSIAAHLAAQHQPGALILASAFTAMPELAADLYPYFPARWLVRSRYDTLHHLKDVHAPVLIAHSREDEIIPFRHGQTLFRAAHEPRQFLELRGGHNDLFFANSEVFAQEVGAFARAHLTTPH